MENEFDVVQYVGLAGHEDMNELLGAIRDRLFPEMGKKAIFSTSKLMERTSDASLCMKRAGFVYFMMGSPRLQQAACEGRIAGRRYHPIDVPDMCKFVKGMQATRRHYVCQLPDITKEKNKPSTQAKVFMDAIRAAVERGGIKGYAEGEGGVL